MREVNVMVPSDSSQTTMTTTTTTKWGSSTPKTASRSPNHHEIFVQSSWRASWTIILHLLGRAVNFCTTKCRLCRHVPRTNRVSSTKNMKTTDKAKASIHSQRRILRTMVICLLYNVKSKRRERRVIVYAVVDVVNQSNGMPHAAFPRHDNDELWSTDRFLRCPTQIQQMTMTDLGAGISRSADLARKIVPVMSHEWDRIARAQSTGICCVCP